MDVASSVVITTQAFEKAEQHAHDLTNSEMTGHQKDRVSVSLETTISNKEENGKEKENAVHEHHPLTFHPMKETLLNFNRGTSIDSLNNLDEDSIDYREEAAVIQNFEKESILENATSLPPSNRNAPRWQQNNLSFSQVLETRSTRHHATMPWPVSMRKPKSSGAVAASLLTPLQENEQDLSGYKNDGMQSNEEEWLRDQPSGLGDIYRFVQPRRLSSWVQDDAVSACFKCREPFTIILRKHHCRACGRIFCGPCSSQRLVIPADYESTPMNASQTYYAALSAPTSELMNRLGYWIMPTASSSKDVRTETHLNLSSSYKATNPYETDMNRSRQDFLKRMEDLQRRYPDCISKFEPSKALTDCGNESQHQFSASSKYFSDDILSYVPLGSTTQRVCDDCAVSLQQRRQHQKTVNVFELCRFDIYELRQLGQVCRKWHRASTMCVSMFRQIQYYLSTHSLSPREKRLLLLNQDYLFGHSKWMLQLIKTIDWQSGDDIPDMLTKLTTRKRTRGCMLTMCSRLCRESFTCSDAVEILVTTTSISLESHEPRRILRDLALSILQENATQSEWLNYLPMLVHNLQYESTGNLHYSALGKCLLRQARQDIRFCSDLYYELSVCSEDVRFRRQFDGFRQSLLMHLMDQIGKHKVEELLHGQEFLDILWKIPRKITKTEATDILRKKINESHIFEKWNLATKQMETFEISLPVDPTVYISSIDYSQFEVKSSAEAPIILTCQGRQVQHRQEEEITKVISYRIMYKRDDLRKDAIVQKIISEMYSILKQETQIDLPLVTYRVIPTSSGDGMIEIVERAETLYRIIREFGSILNFLHVHNGHRTFNDISDSFRQSLAAYTVITFLLGVGDRHSDNVMLTRSGVLFHIDYGFILGKDPKPLQPPLRLDGYMIDALGGVNTQQFDEFKGLCVQVFNCLRRHVNLFMNMLTLVVVAVPEITDFGFGYTEADLEAFIIERFLPGQSDDEAAQALTLRMEGKFNESLGLALSDFVHAHANEGTVSKGLLSVGSSVKISVDTVGTAINATAQTLTSSASSLYKYVWGGKS